MNLLEYQAKALLTKHAVPVPHSQLIRAATDTLSLMLPVMLKVQIPVGGRGKVGGIRAARTKTEFSEIAADLLSRPILGYSATELLAEELVHIHRELYLALAIDRDQQTAVLMAHMHGGVDVESAANDSRPVWQRTLVSAPKKAMARELSTYLKLNNTQASELHLLLKHLYDVFIQEDALLVEINPLVITDSGDLLCADAKIELDDAASFRHEKDWPRAMHSQQFIPLVDKGEPKQSAHIIASMANGAGLAMATIDAIADAGATPANFFDVGGGTNTTHMAEAFATMAKLPGVSAIVVNIFGGITRCDDVARAIITARGNVKKLPPLYIRLTGTNEAEGRALLADAGIALYPDLKACITAAMEVRHV